MTLNSRNYFLSFILLLGSTSLQAMEKSIPLAKEKEEQQISICSFCRDDLITKSTIVLSCGHEEHTNCLEQLYQSHHDKSKVLCAQCRVPITEEDLKQADLTIDPLEQLILLEKLIIGTYEEKELEELKNTLKTLITSKDFKEVMSLPSHEYEMLQESLESFINQLTLTQLISQEALIENILKVFNITQDDILLLLKNVIDRCQITSEHFEQLRQTLEKMGIPGYYLLQAYESQLTAAENIVKVLAEEQEERISPYLQSNLAHQEHIDRMQRAARCLSFFVASTIKPNEEGTITEQELHKLFLFSTLCYSYITIGIQNKDCCPEHSLTFSKRLLGLSNFIGNQEILYSRINCYTQLLMFLYNNKCTEEVFLSCFAQQMNIISGLEGIQTQLRQNQQDQRLRESQLGETEARHQEARRQNNHHPARRIADQDDDRGRIRELLHKKTAIIVLGCATLALYGMHKALKKFVFTKNYFSTTERVRHAAFLFGLICLSDITKGMDFSFDAIAPLFYKLILTIFPKDDSTQQLGFAMLLTPDVVAYLLALGYRKSDTDLEIDSRSTALLFLALQLVIDSTLEGIKQPFESTVTTEETPT